MTFTGRTVRRWIFRETRVYRDEGLTHARRFGNRPRAAVNLLRWWMLYGGMALIGYIAHRLNP